MRHHQVCGRLARDWQVKSSSALLSSEAPLRLHDSTLTALRITILGNALFPNIAGNMMKLVNALLPPPGNSEGDALRHRHGAERHE